jgi:hypothetical protein
MPARARLQVCDLGSSAPRNSPISSISASPRPGQPPRPGEQPSFRAEGGPALARFQQAAADALDKCDSPGARTSTIAWPRRGPHRRREGGGDEGVPDTARERSARSWPSLGRTSAGTFATVATASAGWAGPRRCVGPGRSPASCSPCGSSPVVAERVMSATVSTRHSRFDINGTCARTGNDCTWGWTQWTRSDRSGRARRSGRASMLGWDIARDETVGKRRGRIGETTELHAREDCRDPLHPCSATSPRAYMITTAPPPNPLR